MTKGKTEYEEREEEAQHKFIQNKYSSKERKTKIQHRKKMKQNKDA